MNDTAQLQAGKTLLQQGRFQQALEAFLGQYEKGLRSFQLTKYILECWEKLNKHHEMADFLSRVLMENEFEVKVKAQLYYRLGLTHYRLNQYNEARQAFWHLRKIYPNFPGLEDKIKELEKSRSRAKTRHDLLLEKGCLQKGQLEAAKEKAKKENRDLDQLLIDQFKVSKEDLGQALEAFYDVPFVDFDPGIEPPFDIFEKRRLDPDFLKRYGWVPFAQNGKSIEVLMTNPFDLGKVDEVRFILGTSRVEPRVALKQDIEAFIDRFFQEMSGGEELTDFEDEVDSDFDAEDDVVDMEEAVSEQDSEVVRLVNALLVESWRKGVSDIHIEPNAISKYCSVRFRVDGTCHEFRKLRLGLARPMISRLKIMARLDIAERRLPQDGKVKLKLPQINKSVEFRVATMPTIDGQEDMVLRVLASGKPLPLEKLGLAERNQRAFENMIYQPYGMVLVVGPTGSGKTTTLHSSLSYINTPERKIWTAEDPVEITQEGLRQVQVQPKIGLTFASALRSFLRADPDVIMIGEMRDNETAHIGVEASLTGHLVFSTLHTNSAPETVTRLLDMNLDPFNFADSLLCVLAQRLVKTLCPNCKQEYVPDRQELEELRLEFGSGFEGIVGQEFIANPVLYKARGCKQCMEGYKGRIGIHELMLNSDELKPMIKYRKSTEEIRDRALDDGMLTLKQDGILKVIKGMTDIHQVRKVAGKKS